MATLILEWPVTDSSGTEIDESINAKPMYFASSGGYPVWTTGPTGAANSALTFSGSTSSDAHAATDESLVCQYSTGCTIAVWFKPAGTGGGALVSAFRVSDAYLPADGQAAPVFYAFQDTAYIAFWLTETNQARFGWSARTNVTGYKPSVSGPTINTTEWQLLIGKVEGAHAGKIYNGSQWYSTVLDANCGTNQGTQFPASISNMYWSFGRAALYANSTQKFCGHTFRSFYGDIGRTKVFCGAMSDSDIENLYTDMTKASVKNAIMFSCNT